MAFNSSHLDRLLFTIKQSFCKLMCFILKVTCCTGLCLKANYSGWPASQPVTRDPAHSTQGRGEHLNGQHKMTKIYHPYLRPTGIPLSTKGTAATKEGETCPVLGASPAAQCWAQPHRPGRNPNTGVCHDAKWLFMCLKPKANEAKE